MATTPASRAGQRVSGAAAPAPVIVEGALTISIEEIGLHAETLRQRPARAVVVRVSAFGVEAEGERLETPRDFPLLDKAPGEAADRQQKPRDGERRVPLARQRAQSAHFPQA